MSAPLRETRNELQPLGQLPVDDEWLDDLRLRIDDFCALVAEYLEPEQVEEQRAACRFAAEAHAGVYRKSGEPYIFHPLAVARILANVRFDHETLLAALLHDVIEDTHHTKEHISAQFGLEVAELVDGVSKLTQIQFNSKLEAQAENFRKMFLAMAKDLRVIMIKLADRLHNMRTLGSMRSESRRRIARETLEIYAPIAGRLGMNHLRQELEDLGLNHLYPFRFRVLQEAVRKMSGNRREIVGQMEARIDAHLQQEGISARVLGRNKHIWGIYQKMRGKLPLPLQEHSTRPAHDADRAAARKTRAFREVYDVYAVRIIVDSVDTCYRVLGMAHGLYKPIMGRFKDYIAIPKANGYQSLHTVLFGPGGVPIELQIRTEEMHVMAEVGVAAHWRYKPDGQDEDGRAQQRIREWLRKLLDMQRRAGDPVDFLESVKIDLFPDEVYVFTPRGEIIELPRGATAVDFAYTIHSDVGNTCVGARVDRRLVPLRTPLSTGQTVEVIITPTARPNPAWLNFVVTAKARASIRHYLKHLQRDEAILLGKRLLEKSLAGRVNGLNELPPERIKALVREFNLTRFDELLAEIGLGNRVAALIAKRLLPDSEQEAPPPSSDTNAQPLLIKGTEGTVVSFGKCCRPVPGDAIIGFLNTGRGIVVHRDHCKNVTGYKKSAEKWIEVEWAQNIAAEFSAELRLEIVNQRGALATIAAAISETDTNIETINTVERDGSTITMYLLLNVRGRSHLARVMRRLRTLPETMKLARRG
ncbi:MAG: HD domain-containing protein [Candidatus Competibacter denitrificans]